MGAILHGRKEQENTTENLYKILLQVGNKVHQQHIQDQNNFSMQS